MSGHASLLLFFLTVAVVAVSVEGLRRSGRSRYPCCCQNVNPACGPCFYCRTASYTCNCEECTCYSGADKDNSQADIFRQFQRVGTGQGAAKNPWMAPVDEDNAWLRRPPQRSLPWGNNVRRSPWYQLRSPAWNVKRK